MQTENRDRCAGCSEYNVHCTCLPDPSPAMQLRLRSCLASVKRRQSEFWDSLRTLEQALTEYTGATVEVEGSTDFQQYNPESLEDLKALIEACE